MREIKTITAVRVSDEVSDVYRLLNMVHVMAGRCAVAKIDGWELKATCTMEEYIKTTWTNGIVDISAETWTDFDEHRYTLSGCKEVD